MIEKNDLKKIVEAGIQAPSGDNCQPWQVYLDSEGLCIGNLDYKDTSLYNIKNSASYVAIGAMIENMAITAKSLGYDASVKLFPQGENSSTVADVRFIKGETVLSPLLPSIKKRGVNRKKFKAKQLELHAKEALLKVPSEFRGAELCIISDKEKMKHLARIFSLNDRILFENRNLHDFLFNHLRWSREDAETSRDGMSIESLELGFLQSKIFKFLSSWNLVRFLNLLGFSRLAPVQSYKLCTGSSALCVLLMQGLNSASFVEGGRVLQRIWLTAASLGLSLHPMTGITFLIQRLQMGEDKELSNSHRKYLISSYQRLKEILPVEHKSIIMSFRLGYADAPSDKSLRLPLTSVLIEEHT